MALDETRRRLKRDIFLYLLKKLLILLFLGLCDPRAGIPRRSPLAEPCEPPRCCRKRSAEIWKTGMQPIAALTLVALTDVENGRAGRMRGTFETSLGRNSRAALTPCRSPPRIQRPMSVAAAESESDSDSDSEFRFRYSDSDIQIQILTRNLRLGCGRNLCGPPCTLW